MANARGKLAKVAPDRWEAQLFVLLAGQVEWMACLPKAEGKTPLEAWRALGHHFQREIDPWDEVTAVLLPDTVPPGPMTLAEICEGAWDAYNVCQEDGGSPLSFAQLGDPYQHAWQNVVHYLLLVAASKMRLIVQTTPHRCPQCGDTRRLGVVTLGYQAEPEVWGGACVFCLNRESRMSARFSRKEGIR